MINYIYFAFGTAGITFFSLQQIKCKQEANNFLKNSIESREKELTDVRAKAENYKLCQNKDNIELKKKIIELENTVSVSFS